MSNEPTSHLHLQAPNCHIRASTLADLAAIEQALADPRFPRKLPLADMQRDGRLPGWLQHFSLALPDGTPRLWSICLQGEDDCVGQVVLMPRPGFDDEVLSFWLAPSVWGRGLAQQAVTAVIADAFARRKIKAIWAATALWNDASANLMRKLHFKPIAYDGEGYVADGELQAVRAFALTAQDWQMAPHS